MYVIHLQSSLHCARGSKTCKKCTEAVKEVKWRLLFLHEEPTGATMPVIQHHGVWYEFTIKRTFDSEIEARKYAESEGIEELSEK
mmetsp:Transcript_35931/g.44609  ORF Transcript_35931/g.44609 Transcript_35931/m.44609 type:complete len:85 (+) Transcript_35931:184-438(+)